MFCLIFMGLLNFSHLSLSEPNSADVQFKDFFSQFENSELLSSTLKEALERHGDQPGMAVDIGAGTGRDSSHLLRKGFRVLAIDPASQAIEIMNRRFKTKYAKLFSSRLAKIEDVKLPNDVDIVHMAWTSRFLEPEKFEATFQRITESLKVGGRFSGDFCGEKWRHKGKKREGLFLSYEQVLNLFSKNYKFEYFNEKLKVHEDGFTEHLYEVVARRVR